MLALPFLSFRFIAPLLALSLGLSALAAAEPVRVVATGGRIGNTFYPLPAGSTAFRQRTAHQLGGPVAEIQVGFMDWMYPYTAETPNDTNDVVIENAWLERASTGQIIPLTFGGWRKLILPKNSTKACWISDPVPSSAWSGPPPARDDIFWLHAQGTVPAGGKIPVGTPTTYAGTRFIAYPSDNDPGTHDTPGPFPVIAGSTARNIGLPVIFLGRYNEPGHLAVIGIGDSILDGSGDRANPVPVISGFGFFNRAAVDANSANTIATFNLTRHGQSAASFANPARQQRQSQLLAYANVVVEEYGTNDLGQAGTGDPDTILKNLNSIWKIAREEGVQKIIRTKLLPRTRSTDAWKTEANQTPNSNWETGGARDAINTGLERALATGKIDVLLDTLSPVAAPGTTDIWITNGKAKYITADGTHVAPEGNELLAAPLRAALLSLKVN